MPKGNSAATLVLTPVVVNICNGLLIFLLPNALVRIYINRCSGYSSSLVEVINCLEKISNIISFVKSCMWPKIIHILGRNDPIYFIANNRDNQDLLFFPLKKIKPVFYQDPCVIEECLESPLLGTFPGWQEHLLYNHICHRNLKVYRELEDFQEPKGGAYT